MPCPAAATQRKTTARPNIMHKSTQSVAGQTTSSLIPFMSRRRVNSRGSRWEGAAVVLLSQLSAVVSGPPLVPKAVPLSPVSPWTIVWLLVLACVCGIIALLVVPVVKGGVAKAQLPRSLKQSIDLVRMLPRTRLRPTRTLCALCLLDVLASARHLPLTNSSTAVDPARNTKIICCSFSPCCCYASGVCCNNDVQNDGSGIWNEWQELHVPRFRSLGHILFLFLFLRKQTMLRLSGCKGDVGIVACLRPADIWGKTSFR